ncbi:hypothetical protein H5410_037799, partial [Solanum commersonii]
CDLLVTVERCGKSRYSLAAWITMPGKWNKTVNVQLTKLISPKLASYNISWLYITRYPINNICTVFIQETSKANCCTSQKSDNIAGEQTWNVKLEKQFGGSTFVQDVQAMISGLTPFNLEPKTNFRYVTQLKYRSK